MAEVEIAGGSMSTEDNAALTNQWRCEWERLVRELSMGFKCAASLRNTVAMGNCDREPSNLYGIMKNSSQQIARSFANVLEILQSPFAAAHEWQNGLCNSVAAHARALASMDDAARCSSRQNSPRKPKPKRASPSSQSQFAELSDAELSQSSSKQLREDLAKKRKMQDRWVQRVPAPPPVAAGAEGTPSPSEPAVQDGYTWRKYGQKVILGARHPRSYYRCTHKNSGCVAKKQVQRPDDDDSVFIVTYSGKHSCCNTLLPYANAAAAAPPDPKSTCPPHETTSGLFTLTPPPPQPQPQPQPHTLHYVSNENEALSGSPCAWTPDMKPFYSCCGTSTATATYVVSDLMTPFTDADFAAATYGVAGSESEFTMSGHASTTGSPMASASATPHPMIEFADLASMWAFASE